MRRSSSSMRLRISSREGIRGGAAAPGALPSGAARDKVVFDCPLFEGLVHDGCGIVDTERRVVVLDVALGGGRDDAIDHRRRKARVVLYPARERGIVRLRILKHEAANQRAVVRQIVTAEHRKSASAAAHPRHECRHDQSDGASRLPGV